MSYDLLIATRRRPAADAIARWSEASGIGLRGALVFEGSANLLVSFSGGDRTIEVEAPQRVEEDDLPEELAAVVDRPAWLIELHLPGGFQPDDALAIELAVHLARVGDGAVWDPQLDRVTWPRGVTPRQRGAAEERIRVLELAWFVPTSAFPEDGGQLWLDVARSHGTSAVPVRFGGTEPLQGRLDRHGVDGFRAAWDDAARRPFGGWLFWTSRAGGFGGSVHFGDRRTENRPARLGRVVRLSAEFDARPLYRDPIVLESVVAFFATVAERFAAAYGAGCVVRDAILRRERLSWDARSESAPLPRSTWWVGLPALPTWLAWFGRPYRDLIEPHLDPSRGEIREAGILARFGPEPMDVDELLGLPVLPRELVARRRDGAPVDPDTRISLMHGPPSEPADIIPWLD